jgi:ketosteroid isomerase-like protein
MLRLPAVIAALAVSATVLSPASAAGVHATAMDDSAGKSLVAAETAFARMALEQGIRAAFIANFADDGIVFEPAPAILRETWPARPAPADPGALRLEWKPAQVAVARSGDFGYSTGPYTLTDAAHPDRARHGVFFSVWRRDAGGPWRVALDIGIVTPVAPDFAGLGNPPLPRYRGRADSAIERTRLLAQESHSFLTDAIGPPAVRYDGLLAPGVRLHRQGQLPIASKAAVAGEIASTLARITWRPIDARVSNAGDMAVSWGRYRETDRALAVHEGHYAHLWLRDASGRWRLAYDITHPDPG